MKKKIQSAVAAVVEQKKMIMLHVAWFRYKFSVSAVLFHQRLGPAPCPAARYEHLVAYLKKTIQTQTISRWLRNRAVVKQIK